MFISCLKNRLEEGRSSSSSSSKEERRKLNATKKFKIKRSRIGGFLKGIENAFRKFKRKLMSNQRTGAENEVGGKISC